MKGDGKKVRRVKRWLVEQRHLTSDELSTRNKGKGKGKGKGKLEDGYFGTPANAYLAYPHLARRSMPTVPAEDGCTYDYVIVEEDDVRDSTPDLTSSEVSRGAFTGACPHY